MFLVKFIIVLECISVYFSVKAKTHFCVFYLAPYCCLKREWGLSDNSCSIVCHHDLLCVGHFEVMWTSFVSNYIVCTESVFIYLPIL